MENLYSGMLEATGDAVSEWLLSPNFEARLFSFFPCTDITPNLANKVCIHSRLFDWAHLRLFDLE